MKDVVETAASGRSKCRGCKNAIPKGALRFGEVVPNPFGEGDATYWFHLECAAEWRPEKLEPALAGYEGVISGRAGIERAMVASAANPKLRLVVGASRAPTGRARCRQCREAIQKGSLRVSVLGDEDILAMPVTHFLHATCLRNWLGSADGVAEKLERTSTDLDSEGLAELRAAYGA